MDKEYIISQLSDWLSDPLELGRRPSKVEYVKSFTYEGGSECHILKFRTELLDKWKLGIVSPSGTYSEMKEFSDETAEDDAREILSMLQDYWIHVADTLKPVTEDVE